MSEKKTILFLEDEKQYLATLSSLLREQGYAVVETSKADDALAEIVKHRPDMILADIKLPGADGFDFFEQVKKNGKLPGNPVHFPHGLQQP